jgi:hypothetical protein
MCSGLTDNYVRVLISGGKKGDLGREINIRVHDVHDSGLLGSF